MLLLVFMLVALGITVYRGKAQVDNNKENGRRMGELLQNQTRGVKIFKGIVCYSSSNNIKPIIVTSIKC